MTVSVRAVDWRRLSASGLRPGQVDDFQDASFQFWLGSAPTNSAANGHAGPGDRFLLATCTGTNDVNSRLLLCNIDQWAGNYLTAGVGRVAMDLKNFGTSNLSMRLVVKISEGPGPGYANTARSLRTVRR